MAQQSESRRAPLQQLAVVNPKDLQGRHVPEREWIVQEWVPVGDVTIANGEPGTGKTLLAQQLMTSCAIGKPWCGLPVMRCRSFGFFCEDSGEELWRRQAKINARMDVDFSDLDMMKWASGVGFNNILMRFARNGETELTDWFHQIRNAAKDFGAQLVIVDTAATTFGGNENDRSQVTQFIGVALAKLAREIDGAVILNAHPSRAGIANGSMESGSTGWSGSARSRMSLERVQDSDVNARMLTRRKANYASIGEKIELRWHDGFLEPPNIGDMSADGMRSMNAKEVFLRLLDRCVGAKIPLSHSRNSANYAPKIFARRPDGVGFNHRQFDKAMHGLLAGNEIRIEEYGRPSNRCHRLIRSSSAQTATPDTEHPN